MVQGNFENQDNLPIEHVSLEIKDAGLVRKISALDPYWSENKNFHTFERLPTSNIISGSVQVWLERMEGYLQDLKLLLSMEYHRFWSTVLHNSSTMDMLVSFLQEANPPYVQPSNDRSIQSKYQEIRRLVLVVFCRLVTNKEGKNKWMTKEYMGGIIYEKFIFTIPILWDLCLVYSSDNPQTMGRLIDSVFSLQPNYMRDLESAVAFVKESLKYIILQVNKDYESEEPPNLPETFKGFTEFHQPSVTKDITLPVLNDMVLHLLDTTMTLRLFIEIYPKSLQVFKKQNFVLSIVQLYEYAIPQLYEKLDEVGDKTSVLTVEIESNIDAVRSELIDMYREILAATKNNIFSGIGQLETHIEDYLSLMMESLSERLFIRDYHNCYSVFDDLEMLKQAYPDIDSVKTDFIKQAITSNIDDEPEHTQNGFSHTEQPQTSQTINNTIPQTIEEIPSSIREESLISEVKDILPDLGDGFVLKCLKFYNFNTALVINSLLEGTLHASLDALDRNLPIIPEDPVEKRFIETGITRLNVFDGDEFDVMTRDDVDLSKIHTGKKKSKYKDIKDMLDDKSDVRQLADVYSKYNLVCDSADMYADEYDDTYDDDGPPPKSDPTEEIRPFTTPRVLQTQQYADESESEPEPEPNNPGSSTSNNRMDFCVNPELMRAKREERLGQKYGKPRTVAPPRTQDVVGKPKGQGQEKETLKNRDKKEKSKSSRANHNRRAGAQWKRSQGMMPS